MGDTCKGGPDGEGKAKIGSAEPCPYLPILLCTCFCPKVVLSMSSLLSAAEPDWEGQKRVELKLLTEGRRGIHKEK